MEKQMWEESERRRAEERRSEKRKNEKKEDAGAQKGRESRNTAFFQWFVAPESRKVGSLKRRVRSHVVRWEMESCMPLWREARFQGKMYTKHTSSGPLLEVEMSQKCTPLWREAHFEVNMYKTHQLRTTFGSWDVEKVHAAVAQSTFGSLLDVQMSFRVAGAKDCAPCRKWAKKREGFVGVSTTTTTTLHSTRLHYNYTTKITLHYTPLHFSTLQYTTVRYTTLITLHYATPTLPYARPHYTTLH